MEEHRQFIRLDTSLPVNYRIASSTTSQPTTTKNLSEGGICLFVREPLGRGTLMEINIALPERQQPLRFTGEVVWCEQYDVIGATGRTRTLQAGVRFVDITPDDQEAIGQHVILALKRPPA